jgi:hypothetical protein
VLEDLEIHGCGLSDANYLSSQSLKRLSIDGCEFHFVYPMHISAPNLVSLFLKVDEFTTPRSKRGHVPPIRHGTESECPSCTVFPKLGAWR